MKDPYDTWLTKNGGFAKDLTVRDHYAGLAMQELMTYKARPLCLRPVHEVATDAYEMADAMLEARKK